MIWLLYGGGRRTCLQALAAMHWYQLWANCSTWWRHQMEIFPALLALCAGDSSITGEFSAQRPVTRSFDVFFDVHLDKRLSKQSWGLWFETPSRSLWHHCNACAVCQLRMQAQESLAIPPPTAVSSVPLGHDLARYIILWVAHAPGMPGTFSPPPRVSDPDMHHGTSVTHVPRWMPRSLTSGFLWSRRRRKR